MIHDLLLCIYLQNKIQMFTMKHFLHILLFGCWVVVELENSKSLSAPVQIVYRSLSIQVIHWQFGWVFGHKRKLKRKFQESKVQNKIVNIVQRLRTHLLHQPFWKNSIKENFISHAMGITQAREERERERELQVPFFSEQKF